MKIMLKRVRIAFPALHEAKQVNGQGEPKFSGAFIFNDAANLDTVKKAIQAAASDKWDEKAEEILKGLSAKGRLCLHSGDEKPEYDGFAGNHYISASSRTRPLVLDRAKNPVTAEDGVIYAGCYVNASVEVWAQDNQFGKRINAQLRGVQFAGDGEAFSGSSPADVDEFEELEATDESIADMF